MIDHRALTTGVRDLPLAKSVVVVTGFCFSNTVNILSSSKKPVMILATTSLGGALMRPSKWLLVALSTIKS